MSNAEIKNNILRDLLADPDGPTKIAQSMVQPVKMRASYRSLLRTLVSDEDMEMDRSKALRATVSKTLYRESPAEAFDQMLNALCTRAEDYTTEVVAKALESAARSDTEGWPTRGDGNERLACNTATFAAIRKNGGNAWGEIIVTDEPYRAGVFISDSIPENTSITLPPSENLGRVRCEITIVPLPADELDLDAHLIGFEALVEIGVDLDLGAPIHIFRTPETPQE